MKTGTEVGAGSSTSKRSATDVDEDGSQVPRSTSDKSSDPSAPDGPTSDHIRDEDEGMTDRAVTVIRRVTDKLTCRDFAALALGLLALNPNEVARPATALDVHDQVDWLIRQASATEKLCLSFLRWCPFW